MPTKTETNPAVPPSPAPAVPPATPDPAPAPAPADAAPAAADPPTEAQPAAPTEAVSDFLLANILSSLKPEEAAADPDIEPAPDPDATPSTEPAPAAAQPAAPAAAAPAPAKKRVQIGRGNPLLDAPSVPPPPQLPEPPAPAAVPATTIEPLSEEQQDELAEAMVAERLFGDRYKGHGEAVKKWYSSFEARKAALIQQNPNITEGDDEFQALLATKPAIKPGDFKKVVRAMVTDTAVRQVEQEVAPKLAKIEMNAKRVEMLPQINQFATQTFAAGVRQLIQQDTASPLFEPLKLALEKGIDVAAAEYPEEATAMRETMLAQQRRVQEFLLLRNRAVEFDRSNPAHRELEIIINDEGRQIAEYGQKNGAHTLVQNGRTFLPRTEFLSLMARDRAEASTFDESTWRTQKYWTLSDGALVDILAIRTKKEAENRIKSERERAAKLGYVKPPKKTIAAAQTAAPKAITPPKATPSAAPGSVSRSKPAVIDNSPIPVSSIASSLKMTK